MWLLKALNDYRLAYIAKMISKFRIADIMIRIACSYTIPTVAAQQHLVLLYSGRNAYILVSSELDLGLSRLASQSRRMGLQLID